MLAVVLAVQLDGEIPPKVPTIVQQNDRIIVTMGST